MAVAGFGGFPNETMTFLKGIAAHNDKTWFDANRDLYEAGYVSAARAFVEAVGPELQTISPEVQYASKVNGSLSRINRDIRFSKDKRPYKDHLDLWFWHGEKRGWECPGFYMRISPERIWIGVGMHMMPKDMLARYRDAVVDDKAGAALEAAVAKVTKAGDYPLGEPTRKQVPRGYDKDHSRAEYLLREGLGAGTELLGEAALAPDFASNCVTHWRNCWPIGQWMLDELS
jgi:uncharacterized protein (TIGR02453 family)